jgi:hypothetical protein
MDRSAAVNNILKPGAIPARPPSTRSEESFISSIWSATMRIFYNGSAAENIANMRRLFRAFEQSIRQRRN